MAYTFTPTPSGTIQVSLNGKIVATTTPQQASLVYGYGQASAATPSTTPTVTNASTPVSSNLPPIPQGVYDAYRQTIAAGADPQQVLQQLQSMLGNTYGGTIDTSKLFAPMQLTKNGVTYNLDTSGTLTPANASIKQSVVSPQGISTSTATGTATGTATTGQGIAYDPTWGQYGITQNIWGTMNPTQQATMAAALTAGKTLYSQTGNAITLEQALQYAQTDPTLLASFADAQKLDAQAFQTNLQTLQAQVSGTALQQQAQFNQERQQLAETSAAQGQAYSGFRNQAQQLLGQEESAVMESTTAQNQQALQNLVSQYESKYGSATTPSATLNYGNSLTGIVGLSGTGTFGTPTQTSTQVNPLGGITGSQPLAQEQATLAEAQNVYNLGALPTTK